MPTPDHKLVKDQAMSMGSPVTSPDAAYVYTMVNPRNPPITVNQNPQKKQLLNIIPGEIVCGFVLGMLHDWQDVPTHGAKDDKTVGDIDEWPGYADDSQGAGSDTVDVDQLPCAVTIKW